MTFKLNREIPKEDEYEIYKNFFKAIATTIPITIEDEEGNIKFTNQTKKQIMNLRLGTAVKIGDLSVLQTNLGDFTVHESQNGEHTIKAYIDNSPILDRLTGLLLEQKFMDAVERRATLKDPFIIVAIDVDNFKFVNDLLGHDAGDKVLVKIAEVLREHFRKESFDRGNKSFKDDLVARRYAAGDEFFILFQSDNLARIEEILNHINISLATLEENDFLPFPISLTYGYCLYDFNLSPTENFCCADQIAIDAKQAKKAAQKIGPRSR